jgi:hypothetical protein
MGAAWGIGLPLLMYSTLFRDMYNPSGLSAATWTFLAEVDLSMWTFQVDFVDIRLVLLLRTRHIKPSCPPVFNIVEKPAHMSQPANEFTLNNGLTIPAVGLGKRP